MTRKILLILLIIIALSSLAGASSSLQTYNGSTLNQVFYDRALQQITRSGYNSSYGSDSYMDHSMTTPNIYLEICNETMNIGDQIDLVYTSKNKSVIQSTLLFRPQIHSFYQKNISNQTINCTKVDVLLAASKTLYPGYLTPIIVPQNSTYDWANYNLSQVTVLEELPVFLNGSFDVGIEVIGPPKKYEITVVHAYDEQDSEITRNSKQLIVSFLSRNQTVDEEEKLGLGESMIHTKEIVGGETVYVNDLKSLEILTYSPCTPINGSGYYLMNDSAYNQNETCINITNSSQLVINFGDEIIVGDGNNQTGSRANNTCAVMIKNSDDITVENLKTTNYYYGLCVENSSVTVYGTGTTENFRGARVDKNSTVTFVQVKFTNEESEIISRNDSEVTFYSVNLTSAQLKSTFKNIKVKSVESLPEPLTIPGLKDIGQFVEYINLTTNNSRAQISFEYKEPLPNNVVTDNITIYEYERGVTTTSVILRNRTVYNTTTNTTTIEYYNETITNTSSGNWSPVYTLVSPSEGLIISPTLTSFSIFAPYGEEAPPNPEPTPQPTPTPNPVSGTSSGNGGTPQSPIYTESGPAVQSPIFLNLTIPSNISLMQGEAGEINFKIKNIGHGVAENLLIAPDVRRGWDYSNQSIKNILPGEEISGNVMLAPYEKELPGDYLIPVSIYLKDVDGKLKKLQSEILKVKVLPRLSLDRLKIIEYPPEIKYAPYSEIDVSFLAKNIGDSDLNNISAVIGDSDCVKKIITKPTNIEKGSLAELKYTLVFGNKNSCYTNIKFYDGEKLVGFLPIHVIGEDKGFGFPDVRPAKKIFWIILIIVWSILTLIVFERKRRRN